VEWDDVFPWFVLAAIAAFGLALKSSFEARALRTALQTLAGTVQRLGAEVQRLSTAASVAEQSPEPTIAEPIPQSPVSEPAAVPPAEAPEPAAIAAVALAGPGKRWE
jgi:hypothetical protein